MIKTVIIDDELRNIKLIRSIVADHCPQLEIVGSTHDFTEVLLLVQDLKPSLLLLDIEFPGGLIFPVLEKLTFTDFQVIFITAHNSYAAEAFKQNAADYILKPVTTAALVGAVKKVEAKIRHTGEVDVSKLLSAIKSELIYSKKIPLPSAEGILFINETEIIRCEANGRYTLIYTTGEKKILVTKSLKEIEMLLSAGRFFRVHHSHIINLEFIKKYNRGRGGSVELTDGCVVEVSFARRDELLNVLLNRSGG